MRRSSSSPGSSAAPQILLATIGEDIPSPDDESPLLVEALCDRDVRSQIVAWDAPIDWASAALVVVRSPWDYVERLPRFVAWLRATAAVTTLVNDAELIAWNLHKGYLLDLARAGVAIVPTSVVARGAGAATQAAARTAHGEEVVIKPAISAGARGTIRTTAASTAARAHLAALVAEGDALVQPYLPTVQDGEVSLVYFGGVLSHAVRKLPPDGDFRVQAFLGGSVEPHIATAAEREVADAVLGAIPRPAAYARIDVVTIAGEPLLMEAELIEPELFLPHDPAAAGRFADVLVDRLRAG